MRYLLKILTVLLVCAVTAGAASGAEKKFTVVIDAGHGGKDIGAADNDAQEKAINLGVALQLGDLIKKKMKDAKVVYTRDNDTFISLQGRADAANKAKGDIFISIHTNSVDAANKNRANVCGATTYILGTHKDRNNQQVARRENSVMVLESDYKTVYQDFNPNSDESNIIFDLAQKDNMQNSIRLAGEVQKHICTAAERKNRGVHQAGFWVLWATSMPSILVELDFICNPEQAQFLSSGSGQKKLAEGIFQGIKSYRSQLRNAKVQPMASEERIDADAVIETQRPVRRVVTAAPASKTKRADSAAPRRRRSASARRESANRQIGVAVIDMARPERRQSAAAIQPAAREALAVKEEKKAVAKNTNSEKTGAVASPARKASRTLKPKVSAGSNFHARLDKKTTVYKIELFTSDEHLRSNSPKFCGLSPVSCVKDHNEYRYMYGETTDRTEAYRMLESVKRDIPEARVVAVRRGAIQ